MFNVTCDPCMEYQYTTIGTVDAPKDQNYVQLVQECQMVVCSVITNPRLVPILCDIWGTVLPFLLQLPLRLIQIAKRAGNLSAKYGMNHCLHCDLEYPDTLVHVWISRLGFFFKIVKCNTSEELLSPDKKIDSVKSNFTQTSLGRIA